MMSASRFGFRGLLTQIQEDLRANQGYWSKAGFQALALYRCGVWVREQPRPIAVPGSLVYRLLSALVRNVYGIELPRSARIGRRLRIAHQAGVVISYRAEVGDDCMIRQNVTIGQFNRGRERRPPFAPTIGDRVEVGAGAVVLGGITIGDGARIGPNAVVMTDVPAGGSVFAPPAKVIRPLRPSAEQKTG
jgi:serine O-acetyltransferase